MPDHCYHLEKFQENFNLCLYVYVVGFLFYYSVKIVMCITSFLFFNYLFSSKKKNNNNPKLVVLVFTFNFSTQEPKAGRFLTCSRLA